MKEPLGSESLGVLTGWEAGIQENMKLVERRGRAYFLEEIRNKFYGLAKMG
jgi:hypothetical protein